MVHSLHSLLVSCEEGEAAKVRTILQSGEVGVNSADEAEISGLQVAAANGHIEIVSELLARGAKVNLRSGKYSLTGIRTTKQAIRLFVG